MAPEADETDSYRDPSTGNAVTREARVRGFLIEQGANVTQPMGRDESEPIRVLVVDDDAALAELTATFLARHGIQAETATTGRAGLRRLGVADPSEYHGSEGGANPGGGGRNEPGSPTDSERAAQTDGGGTAGVAGGSGVDSGPGIDPPIDSDPGSRARIDCVVSDQDMPDLTGIEFLRAVREGDPELPFVLFTGKGSEEIASAAISAGVSEYLRKEHGTEQYAVLANRIRTVVARNRGERALRAERAFTESTFDATPMSVYAFDGGGAMMRWNERFAAVTGYTDDEIAGMNALDFIPSAQHEWMAEQIGHVLAGEVVTIESGFRTKEGGIVPQEFRAARITDSDGAVVGLVGTGRDLTDQKEREREQELFRRLLDRSSDAVFVLDPSSGNVLDANETARRRLGYDREELFERSILDFEASIPGENAWREHVAAVREEGGVTLEGIHRRKDGSTYPVEINVAYTDLDRPYMLAIARDISDRRERERDLAAERKRLAALFENASDCIAETEFVDGEPIIRRVNAAFEATFGYDENEVVGRSLDDLLVPDDRREEAHEINERAGTGTVEDEVQREIPGGIGDFLLRDVHLEEGDESGDGRRAYAVYTDVTERRRAEERFQSLVEHSSDMISVLDRDGIHRYQSPSTERIVGYEPAELVGENAFDRIHPNDRERVVMAFSELSETAGETTTVEYRFRHADGSWRVLESTATNRSADPSIEGIVVNSRDVTERRERERELREQKAFVESVFQAIPDVFFTFDDQGNFLRWNDRLSELSGYDDAEIAAMAPIEFIDDDGKATIADAIAAVFAEGGVETREAAFLTKDGREIPHEFNGTRITDEDGTVLGLVGTGRDITERKEHERTLERQNDRLEEFASVLSHDLRNPLGVATGYLELARETGDPDDFERVERAHERIEQLIERILAEARYGRVLTDLESVSLAAASEAAFATVDTGEATLDIDIESGTELVADDERLRQLLENLFRNSVEHGSTGSRPSADDCVEHGGSDVSIEVGALSDGFFVADDGPGIDPAEREVAFEYGFSTTTNGTGFGLAIVARIAEAHSWDVSVTESEYGGARFEITGVEKA